MAQHGICHKKECMVMWYVDEDGNKVCVYADGWIKIGRKSEWIYSYLPFTSKQLKNTYDTYNKSGYL